MIKPIQTRYGGCLFRSRLEARWAVFFDSLNIQWNYEPEGFELGEYGFYLPDFWLSQHKFLIEVKPEKPTHIQEQKVALASMAFKAKKGLIFFGDIPRIINCWNLDNPGQSAYLVYKEGEENSFDESGIYKAPLGCSGWCWDLDYQWCQCPKCARCGIEFEGRTDRIGCGCPKSVHGDKGYGITGMLAKAYEVARFARF